MSADPLFRHGCTGKVAHESRAMAASVAKRYGSGNLDIYTCKWCNKFHVGGTDGGRRRDRGRVRSKAGR